MRMVRAVNSCRYWCCQFCGRPPQPILIRVLHFKNLIAANANKEGQNFGSCMQMELLHLGLYRQLVRFVRLPSSYSSG